MSGNNVLLDSNLQVAENQSSEAVNLEGIGVFFKAYRNRSTSLKQSFLQFFKRGADRKPEMLCALKDVSLQVKKGEILGILGSNGSGKSTLLKVISGVLTPSAGKISTAGQISSLIELGAGFDPELTAVENVYLHGSLHRKNKAQVSRRVDKILEFAELAEFANTPIKYFSSGMYARLGFSAAIDIDPDILIIDEILSVGDQRFQEKSSEAIKSFFTSGKTILLVSHDLELIKKLTNRVVLLSRGRIVFSGDPEEGVRLYQDPHYQTTLG